MVCSASHTFRACNLIFILSSDLFKAYRHIISAFLPAPLMDLTGMGFVSYAIKVDRQSSDSNCSLPNCQTALFTPASKGIFWGENVKVVLRMVVVGSFMEGCMV